MHGKGARNVTRLTEDDGGQLRHLIHYTDTNGTSYMQHRVEVKESHVGKRANTYKSPCV